MKLLLNNIEDTIKFGNKLAQISKSDDIYCLKGNLGSGKTTIINLLNRFYEPQEGIISLDGVNISEIDIKSLRSNIALVLQDVFLFADTLLNNITLWNKDVPFKAVTDAAKKIGIHDYFEYVAGYNTFEYCKPDPRHLTTTIEILNGDKNKSIMIGDSETDANAAKAAEIPIILLKYGYTEKRSNEIYHNHLVKDFIGIEKIVSEYL